jgi:hypothetical protein
MIALLLYAPEGIPRALPFMDASAQETRFNFLGLVAPSNSYDGCSNKSKLSASHNKIQATALIMVGEMQFVPDQMASRRVQVRAKVESTFEAFLAKAA